MQTTTPLPPPPPPGGSSSGSPPRRLYRAPADERMIGGVAAGLADYLAITTGLARFAFVALSLVGGLGLILYIAGLLLMPERPPGVPPSTAPRRGPALDNAGQIVGAALIVIAGSILFDGIGIGSPQIAWALGLIALGVVLFRRAEEPPARADAASDAAAATSGPPGTPVARAAAGSPPPPASAGSADPGPGYRGPGGVTAGSNASAAPPPRRSPRPHSPLGRITFALALVVAGVLTGADQLGLISVAAAEVLAAALLVLGLGVLVGSVVGRARVLIIPVLLLVPIVLAAGTADLGGSLTVGERRSAPTGSLTGPLDYALGVGTLEIDLRGADLDGRTVDITAEIGLGELVVVVPDDVGVEADARVVAGEIDVLGERRDGLGVGRATTRAGDPGAGTLRLSSRVGLGEIHVRRAPSLNGDTSSTGVTARPHPTLSDVVARPTPLTLEEIR